MNKNGFTLIEMVVAVVILGIMGALGGRVIIHGVQAYYSINSALEPLSKLRYATERIGREFREIGITGGAYMLTTGFPNDTVARFTKADGTVVTITENLPLITMSYSTVPGTYTLIDDISGLQFRYLQIDGSTAATSTTDVALVELNLSLVGGVHTQRTQIALRNK